MVVGLDKFKEAFADFKDNYVIIGGTACDIILSDTDMLPRATDDIDMILVVEKMTKEYGDVFWQFIKDGNYMKLIATASIPEPLAVPQSVYDSVMEYAASIDKELPSQSLQDALKRDADAIQAFVDTLKESFVVSK